MACKDSNSKGTVIDCNYVILFEWDPELEAPFQLFLRTKTISTEIPESWMTKNMTSGGRFMKRKLKCMDSRVFSIFAKMERGENQN